MVAKKQHGIDWWADGLRHDEVAPPVYDGVSEIRIWAASSGFLVENI